MVKNSWNFIMKITKRQLKRLIEATIEFSDAEKESGLSPEVVKDAIAKQDNDQQNETLEKLPIYKKYSYGLDDIPNAGKAEDDIIGHT